MPLAATFQPAASSAARALAGSTRPGSDGFHAAVVSPCFPGFFTDSTSSQNSLCFAPLSSITTPCFPADTTLPERPPQDGRGTPAEHAGHGTDLLLARGEGTAGMLEDI